MTPETAATILNVGPDATRAEIEKAFKLRARLTHPDRFQGSSAGDIKATQQEFARTVEAKDFLLARIIDVPLDSDSAAHKPAEDKRKPSGPELSYEEFVMLREASGWIATEPTPGRPTTRTTPVPQAAGSDSNASADKTTRSLVIGFGLVLAIIAIVVIGVNAQGRSSPDRASQDVGVSGDVTADTAVSLVEDQSVDANECPDACWMWQITPATTCHGTVSISFADTADGDPTATDDIEVSMTAGTPQYVVEQKILADYAAITKVICTD